MYKAIFFDLDGTLTESGEGITKSVQYALEKIGKPEEDLEKLKVFVGPPLMEQFMKYAGVDEATGRKAVEFYRERYEVKGIYENHPYESVEEMLQELKRKGYILAVASSKPEYYVTQILDYFKLSSYFDVVVGSEMNGARTSKSEVIEEALKRINMSDKRNEVLMVGDKEHDVLGARAAGLDCVAVAYGTGLITMIPCLYFYKKDRRARIAGGLVTGQKPNRLSIGECGLILVMGAGFAQFANMFVNMIGSFLNAEEYQETMSQLTDGKSMFFLIVCMGIIAPLAEEIVFRWLIYLRLRDYMRSGEAIVISGLFFGIYHGNLVQGVYASILGCLFAYFLEQTGSLWTSVLLHMGANIWSLVLPELAAWLLDRYPMGIAVMLVLLLTGMCAGISYFRNRTDTEQRRII